MNKLVFPVLAYTLCFSSLFSDTYSSQQESCATKEKQYRLTARNQEGTGVAYNLGYSSLDLFGTHAFSDRLHSFIDTRGHIFNNGMWAANAGVGARYLAPSLPCVFGANAFYDYRQDHHRHFNQVGAGLEALWTKWDLHLNGYIPVGKTHFHHTDFWHFHGHEALFRKTSTFSFPGADARVGRELWRKNDYSVHSSLGGYYFSGHHNKQAGGALLNVDLQLGRYISLSGQTSYDSLFKWRGFGELAFNFSFGPKQKMKDKSLSCSQHDALTARIGEKVSRFEIIVKSSHKKSTPAIDPSTGEPLHFVFVDNQRGSSDGSFENPYRTLAEAQSGSTTHDILYIFAGDGTSTHMDEGITLKNYQQLIGSSGPLFVDTLYGAQTIPAQTSTIPVITHLITVDLVPHPAVLLANHNVVSYLKIEQSDGPAIENNGTLQDATLTHLTLINNGIHNGVRSPAIYLGSDHTTLIEGNIIIADNTISNDIVLLPTSQAVAITSYNSPLNLTIERNDVYTAHNCFELVAYGSTIATSTISHNTIHTTVNTERELHISTHGTAHHTSDIAYNLFRGAGDGVFIDTATGTTQTVTVQHNTFDATKDALHMSAAGTGFIRGSILNNTFENSVSKDISATTEASTSIICLAITGNTMPLGCLCTRFSASTLNISQFSNNTGSLSGTYSTNATCP